MLMYIMFAYLMLYIMFAYLMLYIMFAYLMLFTALFNAVCLYHAYCLMHLTFASAFCFHALSLGY